MTLKKLTTIAICILSCLVSFGEKVNEKIYVSVEHGNMFIDFFNNGHCTISFSEHTEHIGGTTTLFIGTYIDSNNIIYLLDSNRSLNILMHLHGDTLIMKNGIDSLTGIKFKYYSTSYGPHPKAKFIKPIDTVSQTHIYRQKIPNKLFSIIEPQYKDLIKYDYWIEFSNNTYRLYWKNILFFGGTVTYDDECNIFLNTNSGRSYKARWVNNKAIFIDNFFSESAEFYMN